MIFFKFSSDLKKVNLKKSWIEKKLALKKSRLKKEKAATNFSAIIK